MGLITALSKALALRVEQCRGSGRLTVRKITSSSSSSGGLVGNRLSADDHCCFGRRSGGGALRPSAWGQNAALPRTPRRVMTMMMVTPAFAILVLTALLLLTATAPPSLPPLLFENAVWEVVVKEGSSRVKDGRHLLHKGRDDGGLLPLGRVVQWLLLMMMMSTTNFSLSEHQCLLPLLQLEHAGHQFEVEPCPYLLPPLQLNGVKVRRVDGGGVLEGGRGRLQVEEDLGEGGPVAGRGGPAGGQEGGKGRRTGGGHRQRQTVAAHAPDDGGGVDVAVGNLAVQQLPEEDAEAPDVDLLRAGLVADDFGGHPGDRPREGHLRGAVVRPPATGAKVADLQGVVEGDEDVGGLEVAVDDAVVVEVVHARGDLPCPLHDEAGRDLAAALEQLVELSVGTELHDDAVAAGRGAAHPPEGHDVRVADLAEVAN
ncbi:hypothetical protein TYRP_020824, partial [Tyrophagus putrescentiae]